MRAARTTNISMIILLREKFVRTAVPQLVADYHSENYVRYFQMRNTKPAS